MRHLFNKLNPFRSKTYPAKKHFTFEEHVHIDRQADDLLPHLLSSPYAIVRKANEQMLLDVIAGKYGVEILYRAIKQSTPYDGVSETALAAAVTIKHKRFDLAEGVIGKMKSLCSGYSGRVWYINDNAQGIYGRELLLHIHNEDPCLEQMKKWIKKSPFRKDIEAAIWMSAQGHYATVVPFMRAIGGMSIEEFSEKLPAFMGENEYAQDSAHYTQRLIKEYLAEVKSGAARNSGPKP